MASNETTMRRDSGNSTLSNCNMSVKSSDFDQASRKNSQLSQVSTITKNEIARSY